MKSKIYLFILLLILFLPLKSEEIFPLSEVKEGLKGVGYTVLKGEEKTTFDFEVLGVQPTSFQNKNMIICRILNDEFKESGTIAGMSGSPLYINGKFLGAVASTYLFTKEPICVVTPAERMVELYSVTPQKHNNDFYKPIKIENFLEDFNSKKIDLESLFRQFNLLNFELTKGEDKQSFDNLKIEPGDMIGVSLITGDINLTAYGSVSSVKDKTLLAFGHPFFGFGDVDFPLFKAKVTTVVPSYAISFKLASSTSEIGSVSFDGDDGIVCNLSKKADTIEVEFNIEEENGKIQKKRIKFVRHKLIAKNLFLLALSFILDDEIKEKDNHSIVAENIDFTFENKKNLSIKRQIFGGDEPLNRLLSFCGDIFDIITSNPFEKVKIKKIVLNLKIINKRSEVELVEIKVPRKTFEKGEKVDLEIVFKEYLKGNKTIKREIDTKDFLTGKVTLLVGDNISIFRRNLKSLSSPPQSFDEIIENLNGIGEGGFIYISFYSDSKQYIINSKRFFDLPPSIEGALPQVYSSFIKSSEKTILKPEKVEEVGYFSGELEIELNIKEKEVRE